jgi:hypothetical protein
MKISQDIKDNVPTKFNLAEDFQHRTGYTQARVAVTELRTDCGMPDVCVTIEDQCLEANDCYELSVFFKRLGKALDAA